MNLRALHVSPLFTAVGLLSVSSGNYLQRTMRKPPIPGGGEAYTMP